MEGMGEEVGEVGYGVGLLVVWMLIMNDVRLL